MGREARIVGILSRTSDRVPGAADGARSIAQSLAAHAGLPPRPLGPPR